MVEVDLVHYAEKKVLAPWRRQLDKGGKNKTYGIYGPAAHRRAIWVTSVRTRSEDQSSISSHPLADLGWKLLIGLVRSSLAPHIAQFLCLSQGPFLRPGLQNVDRVARRGGQGRPSRLACGWLRRCQAAP
jgi:hypothetical protein